MATASFSHKGRRHTVFTHNGKYYCRVRIDGRQVKRCLDTNLLPEARIRARLFLSEVLDPKWAPKAAGRVATIEDLLSAYKSLALIAPEVAKGNVRCLRRIVTECGIGHLAQLRLEVAEDYERRMLKRVQDGDRELRERALRSALSVHRQASSIFTAKLLRAYAAQGLIVPATCQAFAAAKLAGRMATKVYSPPADDVVRATFDGIGMRGREVQTLFWLVVGAGLRRGEAAELRWGDLHSSEGHLWVSGGVGKDGRVIQVRVQAAAAVYLSQRGPLPDYCLAGSRRARFREIPDQLNAWLRLLGWNDQKGMHALRAYVGGRLFEHSPRSAQQFLRHKQFSTTEQFYSYFARAPMAVEVI